MKLKAIHDKLTKAGFSLKSAKGKGEASINEITSWLKDEVIEVKIKTVSGEPLTAVYRKDT